MRFSKEDSGLLDLLNHIAADTGNRHMGKQVIYVIGRQSLTGNFLSSRRR